MNNQLKCPKCGFIFNPNDYIEHVPPTPEQVRSNWLMEHYAELPDETWVAADGTGWYIANKDYTALVDEIDKLQPRLTTISIIRIRKGLRA
jgi:hypothetical protein